MMAILGFLVFAGALAASLAVFAFTLAPAVPRIAALLRGEQEEEMQVVGRLVLKDRRVRPRSMAMAPARVHRAAA